MNLSENFPKTDEISVKATFVRIEKKHCRKNFKIFLQIPGSFRYLNFWQTVGDPRLNKYPTIPGQFYLAEYVKI